MQVLIQSSTRLAIAVVVDVIVEALSTKPDLVLGLATGRTMEAVYAGLVERHRHLGVDFSRCRTFNLDEYCGLRADDPQSYRYYMRRHLIDQVNIDPANAHVPEGDAADPAAACERYEQAIQECGGIDIQLLGIGLSGHIGFNEPLSAFQSRTRVTALAPATRRQNQALFGDNRNVPSHGMTMGVGTILESRRCLLLATGADKAEILARAVEGPLSARVTASALQWHPDAWIIADPEAAAGLQHAEEYRQMFGSLPTRSSL